MTLAPLDLIIIGADYKAHQWATHCARLGHKLVLATSGSDALKSLLNHVRRRRRVRAIMFRYLNDSPRLRVALWKALIDVLLVAVASVAGCRIFWLCHNVDRETRQYFPLITAVRRRLIARAADTIFVTDPLLVEPADELLRSRRRARLMWMCFGSFESYGELEPWGNRTEHSVRLRVEAFATRVRAEAHQVGKPCLVGLCLGRPGPKYLHFDYAPDLLIASQHTTYHVALIVAVDVAKVTTSQQIRAIDALRHRADVLLFDRQIGFHEIEMSELYDFIWRGCADWSTPITVYAAASARKPLLVLDRGFLGRLVQTYSLGAVIDVQMTDLNARLAAIDAWDDRGAQRFLAERSWDRAAQQLSAELIEHGVRDRSVIMNKTVRR